MADRGFGLVMVMMVVLAGGDNGGKVLALTILHV